MARPIKKPSPKVFKVWATVHKGKLIHVRQADYREPAATLEWLGYQPAMLTLTGKGKK